MALVVPNEGEVLLLSYSVHKIANADLKVHIFTACANCEDNQPDEDTVLADFTEAILDGDVEPAVLTLTGDDFTVASVGDITTATHILKTFEFTAASVNLGYYVTDGAETKIAWCEKFTDAPHTLPSGGGTEKITVKLIGE